MAFIPIRHGLTETGVERTYKRSIFHLTELQTQAIFMNAIRASGGMSANCKSIGLAVMMLCLTMNGDEKSYPTSS